MVRIMLCGDLKGDLKPLCEQVKKLHAKLPEAQHFKAIFCVGEFSSEEMDLDQAPPVPVYFVDCGPATNDLVESAPQGQEVSDNLHFLGHYGVTTVAGLKVAYLSGKRHPELFEEEKDAVDEDGEPVQGSAEGSGPTDSLKNRYGIQDNSDDVLRPAAMSHKFSSHKSAGPSWEDLKAKEQRVAEKKAQIFADGCYTPLAIERLKEEIADAGGVDLLLTSEWPAGCLKGVPKAWPEEMEHRKLVKSAVRLCASQPVAEIAAAAEAKYHVVGLSGVFWRRQPWRHERRGEVVQSTGELRCGACRMIAMGAADGKGPALLPAASATAGASAGTGPGRSTGPSRGIASFVSAALGPAASSSSAAPAAPPPTQKWLHGLELDPNALPLSADDATISPWSEKVAASASGAAGASASGSASGAGPAVEGDPALHPFRPEFNMDDKEERRRWKERFGVLPQEMQRLSDKLAKEDAPKEKKEKHKSLYKVSEKEKKRRKTGGDGHLPFHAKERMHAKG